jgi:hypothetical protein
MLLLLLVRRTSSVSYTGQTYTIRQTPTSSAAYLSCLFDGCQSASDGGAVYFASTSNTISFTDCRFVGCESAAVCGGAIYIYDCLSFSLAATTAEGCAAPIGSFCRVWVYSSATGSLDIDGLSASACSGDADSAMFLFDSYSSGSSSRLAAVNCSANFEADEGSGIHIQYHVAVDLRYSTFAANRPAGCLCFAAIRSAAQIECVALIANACGSAALISTAAELALTSCVFMGNTIGYVVAGSSAATFAECIFDFTIVTTSGAVAVSTTSCSYAQNANFQSHPAPAPGRPALPG